MEKVISVVMMGNAPSVRGGITSVISQLRRHPWEKQGIRMEFIPTFRGGSRLSKVSYFAAAFCKLWYRLRKERVDVVHLHMSHNGSFWRKYLLHRLCGVYGVADIVHLHSSSLMEFYQNSSPAVRRRITRLFSQCAGVVVLGERWRQRVIQIAPEAVIYPLPNTVLIPPCSSQQQVHRVTFLYLGVLVERKGVMDLLTAVAQLRREEAFDGSNAHFVIGGSGECEHEQQLRRYAAEHELEDMVTFTGWLSPQHKEQQLLSSQVLVLPSYNEGLPVAVLEGISYGLAVVATDVGDVSQVVHDGENGFLFAPGDIEALKRCLRALMQSSLRERMGAKSREMARQQLDERSYFARLAKIYAAAAEKRGEKDGENDRDMRLL